MTIYTYLSIFVPLLISHKSQTERATKLNAINVKNPASEEVQPGTAMSIRSLSCFKNCRFTWALTFESVGFWAIKYFTSCSSALFLVCFLQLSIAPRVICQRIENERLTCSFSAFCSVRGCTIRPL